MGQSFFSGSVEDTGKMRPFVALSFVLSAVCGAPAVPLAVAGVAGVPAAYAGVAGAYAAGAVTHSTGPAPAGHGLVAHGPVEPIPQAYAQPAAPAPYTTVAQGPGVTTVHQPEPIITNQVHYGQTSYVSGYNTRILKPATPHLPIQVPTVLKGTQTVNAPIIDSQVEVHNVQTPVHVDAPHNAPYPVPVQGEPIIKKSVAPAVVTHSNHVAHAGVTSSVQAAPVVNAAAYAAAPVAAYAAAPAAALVH